MNIRDIQTVERWDIDLNDLTEIYCSLACLGANSFSKLIIGAAFTTKSENTKDMIIEILSDKRARKMASKVMGETLAEKLVRKGEDISLAFGSILESLLDSDIQNGFLVLPNLCETIPPEYASTVANVFVAYISSRFRTSELFIPPPLESPEVWRKKFAHCLHCLSLLRLDEIERVRLFLSLSQSIANTDFLRSLVISPLFPSNSGESKAVIMEGNDNALYAILLGASVRDDGKALFYMMCKALLDENLKDVLPYLGRLHKILHQGSFDKHPLSTIMRASLLLALERHLEKYPLTKILPEDPNIWVLNLLSTVVAGLVDPQRSKICEYIIMQLGKGLKDTLKHLDEIELLKNTLITACVLHNQSATVGGMIRLMLVQTAASLRIQGMMTENKDNVLFTRYEQLIKDLTWEFRRRRDFANILEPVLPIIEKLDQLPDLSEDIWVDA